MVVLLLEISLLDNGYYASWNVWKQTKRIVHILALFYLI